MYLGEEREGWQHSVPAGLGGRAPPRGRTFWKSHLSSFPDLSNRLRFLSIVSDPQESVCERAHRRTGTAGKQSTGKDPAPRTQEEVWDERACAPRVHAGEAGRARGQQRAGVGSQPQDLGHLTVRRQSQNEFSPGACCSRPRCFSENAHS